MRKLLFLVVLGIMGAGQVKADSTCAVGTVLSYASVTSCNFGGLDFSSFSDIINASPGLAAFTAADLTVTPVSNANGVGFVITPTAPADWATNQASQTLDLNFAFVVTCVSGTPCIDDIYEALAGSATATTVGGGTNGVDTLTESYCLGTSTLPVGSTCPGSITGGMSSQTVTLTPTSGSPQTSNPTFSAVTSLAMDKDISAQSFNGSAAVTSLTDEFSLVSTPEPSAFLMLGSGLLLALLSMRRRSLV